MKAPGLPCESKDLTIEAATRTVERLMAENEKLKAKIEQLSPRKSVSPPSEALVLHRMKYHFWEEDVEGPADFELFDTNITCATCIDVAIVRADRLSELESELMEQARIVGMGGERELKLMAENERLRSALAQQGEPMAWLTVSEWGADLSFEKPDFGKAEFKNPPKITPLYAAAPEAVASNGMDEIVVRSGESR